MKYNKKFRSKATPYICDIDKDGNQISEYRKLGIPQDSKKPSKMNKVLKYVKKTFIGLVIAFIALWLLTNTYNVNQYVMTKGDRVVVFQGMVHYADEEFFTRINKEIKKHKAKGYKHYYEMIQLDGVKPEDFSSFIGIPEAFNPDDLGLASQLKLMDIHDDDVNADITATELMDLPAEAFSQKSVMTKVFPRSLVLGVKASIFIEETVSSVYKLFGAKRPEYMQDLMLSLYAGNEKAEHIIGHRNNVLIDFVNKTEDNVFITYGEAHWVDFRDKMEDDGWIVVKESYMQAINN